MPETPRECPNVHRDRIADAPRCCPMAEPWLLGPYIGARVLELREMRGISRTSIAQRAGLTLQALADLEAGAVPDVPVSVLCALAHALRVQPSTLLPERPTVRKRKVGTP